MCKLDPDTSITEWASKPTTPEQEETNPEEIRFNKEKVKLLFTAFDHVYNVVNGFVEITLASYQNPEEHQDYCSPAFVNTKQMIFSTAQEVLPGDRDFLKHTEEEVLRSIDLLYGNYNNHGKPDEKPCIQESKLVLDTKEGIDKLFSLLAGLLSAIELQLRRRFVLADELNVQLRDFLLETKYVSLDIYESATGRCFLESHEHYFNSVTRSHENIRSILLSIQGVRNSLIQVMQFEEFSFDMLKQEETSDA